MEPVLRQSDAQAFITQILKDVQNGLYDAREDGVFCLMPNQIQFDFIVLHTEADFSLNTDDVDPGSVVVEEQGAGTNISTRDNPQTTSTQTTSNPQVVTLAQRSGGDTSTSTKTYEEFAD